MSISKTAAAIKEATFGCEVEFNGEEHEDLLTANLNWLNEQAQENDCIQEHITTPCNVFKHLRRMAFLSQVLGFDYDQGGDEDEAGSLHTHCRIASLDNDDIDVGGINTLLSVADHMRRGSDDTFRGAYSYRARLDSHEAGRYSSTPHTEGGIVTNTKRYWICHNASVDTIENRLMEGATGYVPMLLMPIAMTLPEEFHVSADTLEEVFENITDEASPSEISEALREQFDFKAFMQYAIASYGAVYGSLLSDSGPITNTYEKLPVRILQAALDGASPFEIDSDIVQPAFAEARVFKSMFNKLG